MFVLVWPAADTGLSPLNASMMGSDSAHNTSFASIARAAALSGKLRRRSTLSVKNSTVSKSQQVLASTKLNLFLEKTLQHAVAHVRFAAYG